MVNIARSGTYEKKLKNMLELNNLPTITDPIRGNISNTTH